MVNEYILRGQRIRRDCLLMCNVLIETAQNAELITYKELATKAGVSFGLVRGENTSAKNSLFLYKK